MPRFVYLDHHATTPCDPRVVEAMLPWFTERPGNAASRQHRRGQQACAAVETAREHVAALIGGSPKEVVFTSGATEALNLAIKGAAGAGPPGRRRLWASAIEHPAVLDPARSLAREGFELELMPVGEAGRVEPEWLRGRLGEDALLVALMAANNEIGTLQPLGPVAAMAREAGALFLVDAVQAVGKVPFDVGASGADLVALSAHKIAGPKGVGCLWVRRGQPRVRLRPLIDGGGQERGLRSGTLDVSGIVGFGEAARLARLEGSDDARRMARLRDRLLAGLMAALDGVSVNGSLEDRLPNNLNVAFCGVEASRLLEGLDDVDLSSGSACSTASLEPSHVLRALGRTDDVILSSVRFGLGRGTTESDIDFALERVIAGVRALRG
ncbi:MAG: cysteine desulfurase [Deltaproteobacteria bacterium]|nr:cysteine desulfurase [Deltaproteobacteria bacterium]